MRYGHGTNRWFPVVLSRISNTFVPRQKMAKKEKKSKTAEQKARVAAKQSKKATQKEKKQKSKGNDNSDADDVDLESVLEEYAKRVSKP